MDYTVRYASPLGELVLASDGESLIGVFFAGQKYDCATVSPDAKRIFLADEIPVLAQTRAWLDAYFAGKDPGAAPPVAQRGSKFRQRVWSILEEIPYGRLTTYGAIAQRIAAETGARASARAVGGAVGHNHVSIIVPCHRVVGASGSLTGFGGGLDRKIALLELEGVDMSRLTRPTRGTAL